MRRHTLYAFGVGLLLASAPAYAFLGFGDITYDPSNHAELMSIYEQVVKTYRLTTQQLEKANQIAATLERAQNSVQVIKNTNLHTLAQQFAPGSDVRDAQGLAKISALQASLEQEQSTASSNVGYYQAQINRLAALKRLVALQGASAQGMQQSSMALGEADSSRVTAQSTATLAALATLQVQHQTGASVANAQAAHRQDTFIGRTASLYRAVGQ